MLSQIFCTNTVTAVIINLIKAILHQKKHNSKNIIENEMTANFDSNQSKP